MPRLTRKAISKAIKEKTGHDAINLHNGGDYFYFYSDGPSILDYAEGTSVMVPYLGDLDLDRWVREFEEIISEIDLEYVEECKKINLSNPIQIAKGV